MMLLENTQPKISTGNMKVKDTFIWSLPPLKTCPGATAACKKSCYAKKAYLAYPSAKKAWEHNDLLTWHADFVEIITNWLNGELNSRRKTSKFKYFRIHESGDFYNQRYLDQWKEIARRFPGIKFLAYTKSGWLDFSNCPENLMIRVSIWEDTNPRLVKNVVDELPRAIMDGMEEKGKTFHCKPTYKCHECRFCWDSQNDVKFSLH
ncbi:TPA: hypothetical protein QCY70_004928 [Bacillus cereus]|nr:hypothetical protein [Bacillus cereus]